MKRMRDFSKTTQKHYKVFHFTESKAHNFLFFPLFILHQTTVHNWTTEKLRPNELVFFIHSKTCSWSSSARSTGILPFLWLYTSWSNCISIISKPISSFDENIWWIEWKVTRMFKYYFIKIIYPYWKVLSSFSVYHILLKKQYHPSSQKESLSQVAQANKPYQRIKSEIGYVAT